MRLKVILCGVTASAFVLLLAGCGMDEMSTFTPNTDSPAMTGRAFAGQQPVVGARIEVIQMGTTGYGSAGTVLATTTTDNGGNFSSHRERTRVRSRTRRYICWESAATAVAGPMRRRYWERGWTTARMGRTPS